MKKSLKNNELGITLIALVITIIVLLILAGVALSLVVGENSITKRAITAGEQYDIAGAKEQAELLVASYAGNFYQEKYISENSEVTTIGDYVSEQLKNGETIGDYTLKTTNKKIAIIKNENEIISGTLNDDGTVDWTKTPFDPNTITIGTAVDVDKYGWKVDYVSRYEEENDTTLTLFVETNDHTNIKATAFLTLP